MIKKEYAISEYVTAKDLKRVRNMLAMSQKDFSKFIGVSKATIERWESGKENITGPIVLLLNMLENNPDYINTIIIPPKVYPLRMYYMHNQKICTLIDVDAINHKVFIKNFTDNVIFRAFGNDLNPTYDDYEEFLKSRCFPETRDKLKLVLADLDVPFYDPLLIIEKTKGKMAEDDFWIRIEE